jgi:murein DD-endopeptidase MepM/ murein hydrolase activator NlpD
MRYLYSALLVGLLFTGAFSQQGTDRFFTVAQRLVDGLSRQDYAFIQNEYGSSMADFTITQTTYFFQSLIDRLGKPVKIDKLKLINPGRADFVMFFEKGAQDVQLYLDNQNKIAGYMFSEHAGAPEPVVENTPPAVVVPADKQKTELSLPFKGSWVVVGSKSSGTRNILTQPPAFDFAALDESGRQYKRSGAANEDYAGFGKEVLAPADGVVMEVVDGIRDNTPGSANPYALIGNAIVLQHKTNEYSVFAYLKQNSIRVRVGDRVIKGQLIALCGNSGGSLQPEIHFHLQDSPVLSAANGVKFYFEKAGVAKDGNKEIKSNYMPAAGDHIVAE